MFVQLLLTSTFCILVVQSAITNSSKGQSSTSSPILAKQAVLDEDYDLNDKKLTGEGSGDLANLDEYADEEDDEQLSKVTATTIITKLPSTTIRTTSTTIKTTTTKIKIPEQKIKNDTHMESDEFSEDYKDDLENDIDYNEVTTKVTVLPTTSTRLTPGITTRTPLRVLFSFFTRPPIAAGILTGLSIGILTSVILLICLVQRFNKRHRNHSSYTTGLLYPNQYGYSKSPQEFYA